MTPSDAAIDLDVREVPIRVPANQRIGPDKATEPGRIAGTRGHGFGFIDQETRKPAMLVQQFPQALQKILIGQMLMARFNDSPCLLEDGSVNNRHKGSLAPDPHVGRIVDSFVLQFERAAIVNVGSDVLGVDVNLMPSCPCPQVTVLPENSGAIELLGDLAFSLLVRDKPGVDLLDDLDLILGARDEDDPVRLQALSLATTKQPFRSLIAIDQLAPQAIARGAALPESQLNEPTLAREYLDRELAAVFRS